MHRPVPSISVQQTQARNVVVKVECFMECVFDDLTKCGKVKGWTVDKVENQFLYAIIQELYVLCLVGLVGT